MKYWLDKTVLLMREVENAVDAPLDIKGGTLAIENYLQEKVSYATGPL